jgi:hypothetical protein
VLDSRQLYATLRGLTGPWAIDQVEMQEKAPAKSTSGSPFTR